MASYISTPNPRAQSGFPYFVSIVRSSRPVTENAVFRLMHQHDDLQFVLVTEGAVKVTTLSGETLLSAGEGMFINSNVIHLMEPQGRSSYCSFRFPASMISFHDGSPASRMVRQIVAGRQTDILSLHSNISWQQEILKKLQQLSLLSPKQDSMYYYRVPVLLSSIWLILMSNLPVSAGSTLTPAEQRTETFLHYIEVHYSEEMSLEELAASADVSRSECLRCFKEILHTTPWNYLMDYRLAKAADLLAATALSIGEISAQTGFHQQSYFTRCFRRKTGLSPLQYRKKHSSGDIL